MKIESLHRKIAKSARHRKCPQAVKEAVQRIQDREYKCRFGLSTQEAVQFAIRETKR